MIQFEHVNVFWLTSLVVASFVLNIMIYSPLFIVYSDIDEDVHSLVQFSTEMTVEAVARCIKTINANSDVPHKLPPSMSARFQIGSKLANALQVSVCVNACMCVYVCLERIVW